MFRQRGEVAREAKSTRSPAARSAPSEPTTTAKAGASNLLAPRWLRLLRSELREEDDLSNRGLRGQGHDQTIDAHPEPGGRRQPVLEGPDVVFVVIHRLLVAALAAFDLVAKATRLVDRIVELRKCVADLAPVHEELEPIDEARVRVLATGQR